MIQPDPTKHCVCPGERTMRYHTDHRGRTTLRCAKCKKPDAADDQINFKAERMPA